MTDSMTLEALKNKPIFKKNPLVRHPFSKTMSNKTAGLPQEPCRYGQRRNRPQKAKLTPA